MTDEDQLYLVECHTEHSKILCPLELEVRVDKYKTDFSVKKDICQGLSRQSF